MKTISTKLITQYNHNKIMCCLPESYDSFKQKLESILNNKQGFLRTDEDDEDPDTDNVIDNPISNNGITIVPFNGFTVSDCTDFEAAVLGLQSLKQFCDDLTDAVNDENTTAVVINFDSGGGYTQYGEETTELVKALAAVKPIYAYTSGYLCSMAYKVASCCTNIIASPTSVVGSIGTFNQVVTYNGASKLSPDGITESNLADLGVTVTTFQVGNQKTIGTKTITLNDEQKKKIMADLIIRGNEFKDLVKANRGNVKDEFLQGQAFLGREAMEKNTNLIDGNVNSLSQFIQLLQSNGNNK